MAKTFHHLDEHSKECRRHAHNDHCDVHNYKVSLPEPLRALRPRISELEMETASPSNQHPIVPCGIMDEHLEADYDDDEYDEYDYEDD